MLDFLTAPQSELDALDRKDTRSGFGQGLLEVGQAQENVVALCADLTGSLKMNAFQNAFPDRFKQAGIAEANMIGVAAGMTIGGLVPFTGTFANFSTGRVYDQIRQSVAYSDKNVKICASHCGLTLGEDGATHQILEDVGMMKMLPNMTVIHTCDYEQTRNATHAVAAHHGPVYFRFGRPKVPVITAANEPFVIGKARRVMTGSDVTLVTNGHIVWNSILAARELAADGISVDLIDMHTIKPLDEAALIESVSRTGCVVSAEEHQRFGGLGESVAACLAAHQPTPQRFVAVEDSFGESGTPAQLLEKYGLGPSAIAKACREAIAVKQGLPA
ncbi:MAG: transketolase C-terminal domain-containing protein [Bacteroidota bacterium]|jgi:transketolase|nr:transketolase C-terminal domain-containing protein [Bacteroidota bacterium]